MLRNLEQPRRKQLISLTPLIDVVFILLLFFMLTSSFVTWRTLETPLSVKSLAAEADAPPTVVTLLLKANDGRVWFENESFAVEDQKRIHQLIRQHAEEMMVLRAEGGVSLQSLLTLADQLKKQGAEKLSIGDAFKDTAP